MKKSGSAFIAVAIPSDLDRGLTILDQRIERGGRDAVHATTPREFDGGQLPRTNPIPDRCGRHLQLIGDLSGRQQGWDVLIVCHDSKVESGSVTNVRCGKKICRWICL